MKQIQIPLYKEVLDYYSTSTDENVRKHILISFLMDTQHLKMASHHENYEGNYIPILYARDILGHKKYLEALGDLSKVGLLTPLGKTSTYKHNLHFFEPMDLTPIGTFTVPTEMKRVNRSIDRLMRRKLDAFSPGGKLALKNLQEPNLNICCTHEEYQAFYSEHYPNYCEKKKKVRTRNSDGAISKPLDFPSFQSQYELTWSTLEWYLNTDRQMAWRFVSDDDHFCNRVYSLVTCWPKYIRQHITYKNENTTILDLIQSGPTFLAKILTGIDPDNDYSRFIIDGGDIYQLLMEEFDKVDRESAKRVYNIWAYGPSNGYYSRKMQGIFPEANRTFDLIKSDNYKTLARLIYQEESRVFRLIWDELDNKIGWFLSCHDEIIVPEGNLSEALGIMNGILSTELCDIPFNIREE